MVRLFCIILAVLSLSSCGNRNIQTDSETESVKETITQQESYSFNQNIKGTFEQGSSQTKISQDTDMSNEKYVLKITVGEYELDADFEENRSAEEFQKLLTKGPVTIEMEDYGGFEKVGALGTTLTRSDEQITTEPGDVILYQGNQITIYYGTNSWNFTRLAKINDTADLKEKLGDGTVQVTFSLELKV